MLQIRRAKCWIGAAAAVAALLVSAVPAGAVAPVLSSVGAEERHPTATFSAPGAGSVEVFVASSPARATDGSFLRENVVTSDYLTEAEIQSGRWLNREQIDPGVYSVMLKADIDDARCVRYDPPSYDRVQSPACAEGFSAVLSLEILPPITEFSASATVFGFLGEINLELVATPLGEKLPYRVCWKQAKGKKRKLVQRCANGSIDGYSWNHEASDRIELRSKGMARRTKFTWYRRDDKTVLLSKTFKVR